jgi:hypothetical protein
MADLPMRGLTFRTCPSRRPRVGPYALATQDLDDDGGLAWPTSFPYRISKSSRSS